MTQCNFAFLFPWVWLRKSPRNVPHCSPDACFQCNLNHLFHQHTGRADDVAIRNVFFRSALNWQFVWRLCLLFDISCLAHRFLRISSGFTTSWITGPGSIVQIRIKQSQAVTLRCVVSAGGVYFVIVTILSNRIHFRLVNTNYHVAGN